jgi:thymidylate synthase
MHRIINRSISSAYVNMLKNTLSTPFLCLMQTTKVVKPILGNHLNDEENIRIVFEAFRFPDERTGKYWIDNRINALFGENGEYRERMDNEGQFDYVVSALKGMKEKKVPRWNANRVMISLFNPKKDLHVCRAPAPPCLTTLCFYPVQQSLNLVATFRAQYTDIKAYGNLISVAMLLQRVSEKTGLTPNGLYSVAQKATLRHPRSVGKKLLHRLLVSWKETT